MYTPSPKILQKYADVLVNFALGGGVGIKKGDVVFLQVPECAKDFLKVLRITVLKAGGNPIINYIPDDLTRDFFENATDEQIKFLPKKYLKGKVDEMDHVLSVIAETDKFELKGIDPKKIMLSNLSRKPYIDWQNEKEDRGKMTWTLGLYGTPAMAKEAGMTLKEYWNQIIKGCYLDTSDPVKKWKETYIRIKEIQGKLNKLNIIKIKVVAKDTDLTIGIDNNRKWLMGDGRNIPCYELFISPDWRKTNGKISFSEPLYRYGNLIKGIKLEFKNGVVVKSSANIGENILKEMIKTKDADKIGEFSLTDNRFSKISKFMAETLFDENTGGKYGNTHIALGMAYKDSYPGKISKVTKAGWKKMGYNDSVIHTDIISTTNRKVTATLKSGREIVIYENGRFNFSAKRV